MNAERKLAVWFPNVRTGTGTDRFTEQLVEALTKRGIRAEIAWLPLRAEYAPWTVAVPKPPQWANVAHVNTWLPPRLLPRHLPLVATIHHSVHHPDARAYKGFVQAAYHRFWIAPNERRVLHRANLVIAVSRFVAETTRETLLDRPMQMIYNGVDTECFRPGNRHYRSGEPFRLLYAGSWIARKGVDLLAPIMRELGDDFELRYTGGEAASNDKAKMPANTHDIGRLQGSDAVAAALQDADALLFPSRSEGFGLVVAEAMACGLPVIATRTSSLVEVVEDGITGLLCPTDDIAAFAAAARKLAGSQDLRRRMAEAARTRALDNFSVSDTVEAYVRTYTEAISR